MREKRRLPRPDPDRFSHLPEPVRLEDTIASQESISYPAEGDDYWREVTWMLRVSGAGA